MMELGSRIATTMLALALVTTGCADSPEASTTTADTSNTSDETTSPTTNDSSTTATSTNNVEGSTTEPDSTTTDAPVSTAALLPAEATFIGSFDRLANVPGSTSDIGASLEPAVSRLGQLSAPPDAFLLGIDISFGLNESYLFNFRTTADAVSTHDQVMQSMTEIYPDFEAEQASPVDTSLRLGGANARVQVFEVEGFSDVFVNFFDAAPSGELLLQHAPQLSELEVPGTTVSQSNFFVGETEASASVNLSYAGASVEEMAVVVDEHLQSHGWTAVTPMQASENSYAAEYLPPGADDLVSVDVIESLILVSAER